MVNNNNKILIENKKPIETVQELKETNWWEKYEVKKSKLSPGIKVNRKSGSDYVSERAFNDDVALMQMYGPGFWDDIKGFVKPVTSEY